MRRKALIPMLIATIVGIGLVGQAKEAKQEAPKKQTVCPVSGKPINTNLYVDADGYRIYTCCPNCIAAVKANPEKYIKKMKAEGVTLAKAPMMQKTCPVSGKPINKNLYVDADGYRIYLCCPNCIAAVKANPEKYIKEMKAKGVTLEKTPKKKKQHMNM